MFRVPFVIGEIGFSSPDLRDLPQHEQRGTPGRVAGSLMLVGAPDPELVASAVVAAFTGVLADWLHTLIEGDPQHIAARLWRLLVALHRTPLEP